MFVAEGLPSDGNNTLLAKIRHVRFSHGRDLPGHFRNLFGPKKQLK